VPLSRVTKLYAVEDAKLAKLTADSSSSPTYDAVVDVPGIKSVGVTFEINSVELRGDNKQLDADSTLVAATVSFEHAKLSFDALAVLMGGTITDAGTTPAQKTTFTRVGTDAFNYFKFEAKTPTNGVDPIGGDAHLVFYKCKMTAYSPGLAEENYQTISGQFRSVFTISNDKLFDIVLNETAVAIA
jgi:hypothetical protein